MIQFIEENQNLLCSFPTRLDTPVCLNLEDEIIERVEGTNMPVIFDLGSVDYISSMFLRICLQVYQKKGGGNFSLINVSPTIKKVFKIAGFDKYLNIQ